MPMPIFTLGTAGHIDHGKTTLVKALTGIDTDRLPEEKKRGISIDLGFAHLDTPQGRRVGIVDVPGHERFIRNMAAGVWGIDAFLFTVAADEGIMPQTREHLAILQLLGARRGLFAITKADTVEPEMVDLVREDLTSFLRSTPYAECPILPTSPEDAGSLERLLAELDRLLQDVPDRRLDDYFRLPVDRVFSLKGHGTVVTGTVAGGRLSVGETIEVMPGGRRPRVRSLHCFDEPAETVLPGQRAALNLAEVGKDDLQRGVWCVSAGAFEMSPLIDVRLRLLPGIPRAVDPLKSGWRVRVYLGTAEVLGRVHLLEGTHLAAGTDGLAQLRLEAPVLALRGDRFLIRQESPLVTLGGGEVLDAHPRKHRRGGPAARQLAEIEGAPLSKVLRIGLQSDEEVFRRPQELARREGIPLGRVEQALQELDEGDIQWDGGDAVFSLPRRAEREKQVLAMVRRHHESHPLEPGIDRATLQGGLRPPMGSDGFARILAGLTARGEIIVDKSTVRLASFSSSVQSALDEAMDILGGPLLAEASEPFLGMNDLFQRCALPQARFQQLLSLSVKSGKVVRIGPDLVIHGESFDRLVRIVRDAIRAEGKATTATLKEALGLTRKYLIPFLEHLDETGVTVRRGSERFLRGA